MMVTVMLSVSLAAVFVGKSVAQWGIVLPLLMICLAIVIAIPAAAARSKFHMPAYIGIAILAFAASVIFGEISGMHRIAGSVAGIALSIACFLSVAVLLGSILALFFYRDPPEA